MDSTPRSHGAALSPPSAEGDEMLEHKVGTREEWQAARDELSKLEAEQAERNEEINRKRLDLPWVPVEKEYEFDTDEGRKTLAGLFDGRSQLLAYNRRILVIVATPEVSGSCDGSWSAGSGTTDSEAGAVR